MKKLKVLTSVLFVSLCLTACGSSGGSSESNGAGFAMSDTASSKSMGLNSISSSDYSYSESYDSYDSYDSYEVAGEDYNSSNNSSDDMNVQNNIDEVRLEMLVYSGDITLATKEYEKTMNDISAVIEKYGAFIENSNFYQGSSSSGYRYNYSYDYNYGDDYYNDDVGLRTYTARIRVKSEYFNDLVQGFQDTSKVLNLSTNIDNLTSEYTDLISAIDLYSAKRARYLKQYEETSSDSTALQIEHELTDIELKLAQYEARKKNIETDVAYSYINLRVEEKRPYEQSSTYNSTFGERLKNQIVNTGLSFMEFCEGLLFWLIGAFPYLVIIGVVIFIFIKIIKKIQKNSKPFVPYDQYAEDKAKNTDSNTESSSESTENK